MTINIDHTAKLLQASIDLIEKDKQIALLRREIALQDEQIASLQCRLQRATLPFKLVDSRG